MLLIYLHIREKDFDGQVYAYTTASMGNIAYSGIWGDASNRLTCWPSLTSNRVVTVKH